METKTKSQTKRRSTFAVLFYLNTSKQRKSGQCPVMGRITVDSGIAQFSCKTTIMPEQWDAKRGRAKGQSTVARQVNKLLDELETTIREHHRHQMHHDGYVTAENLKNALTGVNRKATGLIELFKEHNGEFKQRVGVDRKACGWLHYEKACRTLEDYILSQYGKEDIPLRELDHDFIVNFDAFLRMDRKLQPRSMVSYICPLRRMVKRAIGQHIISRNPFSRYSMGRLPQGKYRHLSKEDFKKLLTTSIEKPFLKYVRDIFLFSCFTGLAYADVRNLQEEHLQTDEQGRQWIILSRQKTGNECHILLLKPAIRILEKYRPAHYATEDKFIFNLQHRSSLDYHLAKIAVLCGIEGKLTYHMSRHTYATQICISSGVPMETLSKTMGHQSILTTQIYGKIVNQKVDEDMKKLGARIDGIYQLPEGLRHEYKYKVPYSVSETV